MQEATVRVERGWEGWDVATIHESGDLSGARFEPFRGKRSEAVSKTLLCVVVLLGLGEAAWAQETRVTDPVVVTATKVETPLERLGAAVSIITDEDLRTFEYTTVEESLRPVPGVEIQRSGSLGKAVNIRIRGAGPQQVQVLVDGMRVESPTLGSVDLSEFTIDAIDRIEIVRGPQSTIYGADAIGGIVNVITKKGQGAPSGFVSFEGGSYDTFVERAGVQGASGGFNFNVGASHYDTGGQLDHDDARQTALAWRLGYDFPWKGELSFTGRYASTISELPIAVTVPPPTVFDPNARQELETILYTLAYRQPITAWWEVRGRWGQWWNSSRFVDSPPPAFTDTTDSQIDTQRRDLELLSIFTPARWTTLTTGFEYRLESGHNHSTTVLFPPPTNFTKEIETFAGFIQDELRFFDRVFLSGSTRLEDGSTFGTAVTSRVSLAIVIKETGTKLRGTWGEGFRAPTINDLFFPGFGNPTLKPERSTSWDAGFDQRVWQNRLRFGLTYFDNDFTDLIQFATVPISPSAPFGVLPVNVGRARTHGWEAYAEVDPLDWLTLYANYTNTNTRDLGTGQELRRFPRHHVNLGMTVTPIERLSLFAQALVVSDQLESPASRFSPALRNPAYHRIDVGGTLRLLGRVGPLERLELTARIENVTDETYTEVFGFPSLGFNALVGLRARFQ